MSISLLKRYKNEIEVILSKTKKRLYIGNVSNHVYFTIKCPWSGSENSYCHSLYFGNKIPFKKLLKAVEDSGLVYVGIDLDRYVEHLFLDSSFSGVYNYLSLSDIDRIAVFLLREMLVGEFRYIRNECGDSRNLNGYKGELVLENYKNYIDGNIFEKDGNGNILCKEVGYWDVYTFFDKFVENNYKDVMIKNNKYYKRFVKAVEDFYSNINLKLADGEFPKLNNRKFLPIVVLDFDKDSAVYLYKSRLTDYGGTEMYRKGLNRETIQYFLQSTVNIVPFVNTIAVDYQGKEVRMNNYEHIYVKV